jgi:signal recognition particle receptor subunit beta
MDKQIQALGIDVRELPMVIQCNKQDLPNALPPEVLKNMLNRPDYEVIPAIAINAVGVFETLKAVITGVVINIQKQNRTIFERELDDYWEELEIKRTSPGFSPFRRF